MESDVTVVIPTFGGDDWKSLGDYTALRIDRFQTVRPYIHRVHKDTLLEARNSVLDVPHGKWLVFVDADDDLDPQFVEAVSTYSGSADVLQTAVRGFRWTPDNEREWIDPVPVLHKQKYPLLRQNYLTIGSPVRSETFRNLGGFDDWPVLEDWALWLKCSNAGAVFEELYDAVYYINDNHGRNLNSIADDVARQIRAKYK